MESRIRREVYVRFGGERTRNLLRKRRKARGRLSHYDAVEGVLTTVILLLAEHLPPTEKDLRGRRHIVSVFKLVRDLLSPSKTKGKTSSWIN
ncbi:hypothetical protein [Muriventricola aceti]|uniref:hypothetical protein n=1 Tax=Muriventricola aceti TaxID=2981773 RepID=UPI0021D179C1|nr:hypothetical protein [Muriventricola aceti]MCU6704139.1 hypothetical protein [Muriventricola aceti]